MKVLVLSVGIAMGFLSLNGAAEARPHDEGFGMERGYERAGEPRSQARRSGTRQSRSEYSGPGRLSSLSDGARYSAGPRPRKWCGWWMRTQLGGPPSLNVAWNWRHYGRPTTAQVGAVVVWRGHVGMITGQAANGQWIVKSGNDGGRVRERARSVAGAIFRI